MVTSFAHPSERCHGLVARRTFGTAMLECQAEAISYCCCQALGIPTPNSPSYLALYQVDRPQLIGNLEAIRAGVARIMGELEHILQTVGAAA